MIILYSQFQYGKFIFQSWRSGVKSTSNLGKMSRKGKNFTGHTLNDESPSVRFEIKFAVATCVVNSEKYQVKMVKSEVRWVFLGSQFQIPGDLGSTCAL